MNICGTLNSAICEVTRCKSRENTQYSEKRKPKKGRHRLLNGLLIVRLLVLFTIIPTGKRGEPMISALDVLSLTLPLSTQV